MCAVRGRGSGGQCATMPTRHHVSGGGQCVRFVVSVRFVVAEAVVNMCDNISGGQWWWSEVVSVRRATMPTRQRRWSICVTTSAVVSVRRWSVCGGGGGRRWSVCDNLI